MNRVSKGLLIAAASLAMTGTAFAQDPPADPPAGGEGGEGGEAGGAGEAGGEAGAGATVGAETPAGGETVGAEVSGGMYTKETWPKDIVARPLTLAKGMVEIRGDVFVNLSKELVGKPFAIAPDIYYGVSDKLSIGLTHGLGLCLAGSENGCGEVYNDVGLDVNLSALRDAKMDLALKVGLDLRGGGAGPFDPMLLQAHLGAIFKYRIDKIAIYAEPTIGIGITERDGTDDGMGGTAGGNKETIAVPVTLGFQATPELFAFLKTGIGGIVGPNPFSGGGALLDGFADNYAIPIGVGALFAVSQKLDVGGEFLFPALAGSDIATSDARAINLKVNARF